MEYQLVLYVHLSNSESLEQMTNLFTFAGQRWQLHLTLMRLLHRGRGIGGVLAPLTGSAYMVW